MGGSGCSAHVESKLVGVALVVNSPLRLVEAVTTARVNLVVQVVGRESIGTNPTGNLLRELVLKQSKNPELRLEFRQWRNRPCIMLVKA